jgi:hypothetical protein
MQSKFIYNPLDYILAVCLTNSIFVHYCRVENSCKLKTEVFNYKIL